MLNLILPDVKYQPLHDYSQDYLTFVATENGTFQFSSDINYSIDDGETWNSLASNTNTPMLSASSKIMWKATLTPTIYGVGKFKSSGNFTVEGNVMSLIYGDDFVGQTSLSGKVSAYCQLFYGCSGMTSAENLSLPATTLEDGCYSGMFQGCTSLTTAPELQATTLANYCYCAMFYNCTSLTTAPELPATTLAFSCYSSMFYGCTSLTTAPELLATTLEESCYSMMFGGCTSLTTAPELPATTLADYCYQYMFNKCTSLTTAPELQATTLANYCYSMMFFGCSGLTTVPELLATTLKYGCYYYMFYGCTSLNSITCLATDISASSCTSNWVNRVAASGTFIKAASMSSWTSGINGIPSGWAVVDAT